VNDESLPQKNEDPAAKQSESALRIIVFSDTRRAEHEALEFLQRVWRHTKGTFEYDVRIWLSEGLCSEEAWTPVLRDLKTCDLLVVSAQHDTELLRLITSWFPDRNRARAAVTIVATLVEQAESDERRDAQLRSLAEACAAEISSQDCASANDPAQNHPERPEHDNERRVQ
jgi:hypothetical protein